MGQVLHGSATTTEAVRRARQHGQESLRALAKRYGINQKTVGPVGIPLTEVRFFHLATVFWLIPYRFARALRLS